MNNHKTDTNSVGIPQQIVEQFLKQLKAEKFPVDIIVRLNDTILKKENLSESAIKAALFSEDQEE